MEKLLKNEIQTSYWYLYEYIGILMMLPFLGAIARNVIILARQSHESGQFEASVPVA